MLSVWLKYRALLGFVMYIISSSVDALAPWNWNLHVAGHLMQLRRSRCLSRRIWRTMNKRLFGQLCSDERRNHCPVYLLRNGKHWCQASTTSLNCLSLM